MGQQTPDSGDYRVYLSVGSNIEPRRRVPLALLELERRFEILAISPVYRTRPVDMRSDDQPFHNLCVGIGTSLEPGRLKTCLLEIERQVGRSRDPDQTPLTSDDGAFRRNDREPGEEGYESRPIDLDILLYRPAPDGFSPHPQVFEQAFVIYPLADLIDPSGWPGLPASVREWKNRCDGSIIIGTLDYDWPEPVAPFVRSSS